MDWIKIRKCLETNKIFIEAIVATLLSIMAIIVSCSQLSISKRQYESSIDPVISVELENMGLLEEGVYNLKILNDGVIDICNVEIYENYLTCPVQPLGEGKGISVDSKLFSISSTHTLPKKKVNLVEAGDNIPYTININDRFSHTTDGLYFPCYLRLRIDYRRKIDGKPYQKLKAFSLSNVLQDLEGEGQKAMDSMFPHHIEVRNLLLNNY